MYTYEFTGKGWAVYHNVRDYQFRVSQVIPGDKGREIAKHKAEYLNEVAA